MKNYHRFPVFLLLMLILSSFSLRYNSNIYDQNLDLISRWSNEGPIKQFNDSKKYNVKPIQNQIPREINSKLQTSSVVYSTPDIITSGMPSTYMGKPLTNDTFGVDWSQTIQNEGISQTGNISLSTNFIVNISTTETLYAGNLTKGQIGLVPEWSKNIYLHAGSYVTAKLAWNNSSTDFNLLFIHSWSNIAYKSDLFRWAGVSSHNPERITGYVVPSDGVYTILVDFHLGEIEDYNFSLEFTVTKPIINYQGRFTNESVEFSFIDEGITDGEYEFTTEYSSDLNETLSYNGTIIFNNSPTEIIDQPNQMNPKINQTLHFVMFDPEKDSQVQILQLWDVIYYNYSLYIDENRYEEKANQTGLVDIIVDTSVWPNELDEISYTLVTVDFLGGLTNTTGTIIRADTVMPTITTQPPRSPNVKANESFLFAWVVTDAFPYGTYAIKIGSEVVQSGIWTKDKPIFFNHTFIEEKQYLIVFIAQDAFVIFDNSGTVTDSISFNTYNILYHTSTEKTNNTRRFRIPMTIYPSIFMLTGLVLISKKKIYV